MVVLYPVWFLLAIPLILVLWVWQMPSRWLLGLRVVVLFLVLAAMAGVSLSWRSYHGTLVVVVDRSLSMPQRSDVRQKELLELLQSKMSPQDKLAVVSFGQRAAIERVPQSGKFAGFLASVSKDGSHLSEALELALSMIPQGEAGKILVISDGKWTGSDPAVVSAVAATRGVAVDHHVMERSSAHDVAVARFSAPSSVTPGEAFLLTAVLQVPTARNLRYEIRRNGQVLEQGQQMFSSGRNLLTFRDRLITPGTVEYTLHVKGQEEDPVPENNTARLLLGVRGQKPLLLLSNTPQSGLYRLLQQSKISVVMQNPVETEISLQGLSRYSGVILENILAGQLGHTGMETLAAWVKQTGAGLMMTGGETAYGPGGYFRSPLDSILPVSMELRREHRKLSLAMAIVLDRSGSMAAPVPGGRTKMDLANLGTVETLQLLGPMDELGVLAVDTQPHVIVPMSNVVHKDTMRQRILSIASMGGGIYVYEGLKAAHQMLKTAKAMTKHVILFADAADAEQPGQYKALLEQFQKEGITVSVIGLGTDKDSDAAFLRDVAKRGKGRIFFTQDAQALPQLFAQDTFIVARSTFIKDPTPWQWTAGIHGITPSSFPKPPSLGGYNLCYLRPGATQAAISQDEYKAPIVAYWQVGLGRVLAYTGEMDGKHTGAVGTWQHTSDFVGSLVRWVLGQQQALPPSMLVTQQIKRGVAVLQLHLDPEQSTTLTQLPKVYTVRADSGANPVSSNSAMRWVSPHLLQTEIPLHGKETVVSTVHIPGYRPVVLAPVSLMYSPEFLPSAEQHGSRVLASISQMTQGRERVEVTSVWKDMPRKTTFLDIRPWLLGLAVLLFLLEILERRSGYVSSWLSAWRPQRASVSSQTQSETPTGDPTPNSIPTKSSRPSPEKSRTQVPQHMSETAHKTAPGVESTRKPTNTSDEKTEDVRSALQKASQRAQHRTDRKS